MKVFKNSVYRMRRQCYYLTSLLAPSTSLPCREGQETPPKAVKADLGCKPTMRHRASPGSEPGAMGGWGPCPSL